MTNQTPLKPKPQKRSKEMLFIGYALARFGHHTPPAWLNVDKWKDCYALFYPVLGGDRTEQSFANSLKNVRDAFDRFIEDNPREGWLDPPQVEPILEAWSAQDEEAVKTAVLDILYGQTGAPGPEAAQLRTEGGKKVYVSRRIERKPANREAAIKLHGTTCMACGFNFDTFYGKENSRSYIEVHHCTPLSVTGEVMVDPKHDLVVLCANCHRMVHRTFGVCLSLDELRQKISNQKVATLAGREPAEQ